MKEPKPTDTKKEEEEGRIALWLSPQDIAFIVNEWRKIPETISQENRDTWERLAFRASAALHKSGVSFEPKFPSEGEKYKG